MLRLFHKLLAFFGKKTPLVDKVPLKGRVTVSLKKPNGSLKTLRQHNAIESAGLYAIADQLLASPTLGKPTHGGVGTGTPVGGALAGEVGRVALDTKTRSTDTVTMVFTLPAGTGTGSLTEAGLFDADTSGNCLATTSFTAVNKGASDTLVITWEWQIG